jgi:hypothetical protein
MLMAIAANPVITDRKHVSVLPSSWGTLYQIARLPAPEIERHIADGRIHSKIERKEVDALLGKPPKLTTDNTARLRQEIEMKNEYIAELEAARELPGGDIERCLQMFFRLSAIERSQFLDAAMDFHVGEKSVDEIAEEPRALQ